MKIEFTKMHGIGNKYVYLNCLETCPDNPHELARSVSDVNTGIGSDGLILIMPSDKADYRMRMFNPDGSEAEMCGNAIRCVGKYLYEKGICDQEKIELETLAGPIGLELNIKNQSVESVTVDMGEPILNPPKIPVQLNLEQIISHPYNFFGHDFKITCVSMGNPHVVIFVDEISDQQVLELAPQIETHEIFTNRVNVEFVKVHSPNEMTMRVWERGTGETQACGTGAAAVLVAAHLNNLSNRKASIHLQGGDLELEWKDNNHVYKTGPAEFICDGIYNLEHFT